MTDFIREVDEEVRQDRLRRFVERYWIVLAALAVLVLVAVGAWQAYDHYRTTKAQASGGQYLDALDLARDGKSDEAVAALKAVAGETGTGYPLLARFRLAAETGSKDRAAGARLFDDLAADPSLDASLKNIAKLRSAMLLLDAIPYADLKQRLEPLADANSPVRNAARELLALAALKADQNDDAGRDLDAIEADPTTTGQLRQRVDALQGLVRGAGRVPAGAAPPSPAPPLATEVAPPAQAAPVPATPAAPSTGETALPSAQPADK